MTLYQILFCEANMKFYLMAFMGMKSLKIPQGYSEAVNQWSKEQTNYLQSNPLSGNPSYEPQALEYRIN